MRLFRTAPSERSLTLMLQEMERGRFVEAWRALRRHSGDLPVPPHALARLGRWLAEQGEFKKAILPLQRFLDTYPAHQDRASVRKLLAVCFQKTGKRREAAELARS